MKLKETSFQPDLSGQTGFRLIVLSTAKTNLASAKAESEIGLVMVRR